jgi:hypothetical protein
MSSFHHDNDAASEAGKSLIFSSVEDLDPSLMDGYRLIHNCEIPLEIRSQMEDTDMVSEGVLELIRVKVLILGEPNSPQVVRIELSSEADLFFQYMHSIDDETFIKLQDRQKLMVDFPDFAQEVLIKMLRSCINEPQTILGVYTMFSATEARLDFLQNLNYKFVELFSLSFERSSDATVQHHITYRYNAMKQQMLQTQAQLMEVTNLVKIKNPSLLLQLQKKCRGGSSAGSVSGSYTGESYRGESYRGSVRGSPSRHSSRGGRSDRHDMNSVAASDGGSFSPLPSGRNNNNDHQHEDTSMSYNNINQQSIYLGEI